MDRGQPLFLFLAALPASIILRASWSLLTLILICCARLIPDGRRAQNSPQFSPLGQDDVQATYLFVIVLCVVVLCCVLAS